MNRLDLICAGVNFLAASGAFLTSILGNPRKRIWFPLGPCLRWATFGLALGMTWRAADFAYLAHRPALPGHADTAALAGSLLSLAYWITGAISMLRSERSPTAWRRMGRIAASDARPRRAGQAGAAQ